MEQPIDVPVVWPPFTKVATSGVRGSLPDPPLCWDQLPGNATRHCTIEDPLHDGDHHHEYSGVSWPRAGGQS